MDEIAVYTDGACSNNPGPGGWGVVVLHNDKVIKELSGYVPDTTNNRMELTAAVMGLSAVAVDNVPVTLYTDSRYVSDAINKGWLANWPNRNWRNSEKKPVANRDLWEQLLVLNQKYSPNYVWVKGHSTNVYNNRCDEIAVKAIKDNQL